MLAFPSAIAATFIENWPVDVAKLAAPTISVELDPGDVLVLGSHCRLFRDYFGDVGGGELSERFVREASGALKQMPDGAMPRLGYASWKASMIVNEPICSFRDLMKVMTRDDPRIAKALIRHAMTKEGAWLHLRQWRVIPPESEFRMFIRKRQVIGISQYYANDIFPGIEANRRDLVHSLNAFAAAFIDISHLEDAVIDVWAIPDTSNAISLIEINPFSALTESCLYRNMDVGGFDRCLRFRAADGSVVAVAL
ncbi:MAG: hypothetical protein VR78_18110 [Hoeflea sp. BRH_c9]|nr:MAG: hypothetical protein VR78_18110 [Hoeflea sp. BRH_c9]